MNAPEVLPAHAFKSHGIGRPGARCERRPARQPDGEVAAGRLLPWRVNAVAAEDLLCSGRSVDVALRDDLARVERLYLHSLMKTRDANEGLAAFLAKRAPNWEHR